MGRGMREDELEAVERVDALVAQLGEERTVIVCEAALVPVVRAFAEVSGLLHCPIGVRLTTLLLRADPRIRAKIAQVRDELNEVLDAAAER